MKAVDLAINSLLPVPLQDFSRTYSKKNLEALLAQVALKYPDKYAGILKGISDVGRHASYTQGETLSLKDLRPVIDRDTILKQMDAEVAQATAKAKTPEEARQAKLGIWAKYSTSMEEATSKAALEQGNSLGHAVVSGARGNPVQLKSMLTTPAMYTDYKDNPIEMFIRRSFGEGLRPADYLASSFGTRKSTISTKNSTAKGGDLLKQMNAVGATMPVTSDDCGTTNGLDYDASDPEIEGRVAAKDYGHIKAGDVLDRRAINELHKAGVKKVMVRSPLTCQAKEGICAHCLGTLSDGTFAPKGYAAGITSAAGLGEPITQLALNQKHTSGALGSAKKQFAGFDVIRDLMQSPETFPHRAAVAEAPGRVEAIDKAPQGGHYITVAGKKHYALSGYAPTVKPGDEVEAGDQLSEGVPDVSDIVRLRGLGEGRRYYVDRVGQAMEESGLGKPSKLNLEVLARGTLDHVRVDKNEGLGDLLPDDVGSYNTISSSFHPAKDVKMVRTDHAHGHYLQSPALHFTIGTKLTPKMTKRIEAAGIANLAVSDQEPDFVPEMTRLRGATHSNPDWFSRMHSSYLTTNLAESAERSRDADFNSNVHFAGPLAKGDQFGKKVRTTGKF